MFPATTLLKFRFLSPHYHNHHISLSFFFFKFEWRGNMEISWNTAAAMSNEEHFCGHIWNFLKVHNQWECHLCHTYNLLLDSNKIYIFSNFRIKRPDISHTQRAAHCSHLRNMQMKKGGMFYSWRFQERPTNTGVKPILITITTQVIIAACVEAGEKKLHSVSRSSQATCELSLQQTI